MELYELILNNQNLSPEYQEKILYTLATSPEEAAEQFNRHLTCQWVGRPWGDDTKAFLTGVFDHLEDGAIV